MQCPHRLTKLPRERQGGLKSFNLTFQSASSNYLNGPKKNVELSCKLTLSPVRSRGGEGTACGEKTYVPSSSSLSKFRNSIPIWTACSGTRKMLNLADKAGRVVLLFHRDVFGLLHGLENDVVRRPSSSLEAAKRWPVLISEDNEVIDSLGVGW
jgi:hypothetical protein